MKQYISFVFIGHYITPKQMISDYHIGVDEAGRGPMFGRVYAAAVILPKESLLNDPEYAQIKDSKKFTSKTKLRKVAEYIQTHALAYGIAYADEATIDRVNILQATQDAMHAAITQTLEKMGGESRCNSENTHLEVDGNYFRTYPGLAHMCIEGGDATHKNIAAASILAKLARDDYIDALCVEYPELVEKYALNKNKGYGTKQHLDGIRQWGITKWHRRTFGLCRGGVAPPYPPPIMNISGG
jgi:ribonuclease HII